MTGKDEKARLLASESVDVVEERVVDFKNKILKDFTWVPSDEN